LLVSLCPMGRYTLSGRCHACDRLPSQVKFSLTLWDTRIPRQANGEVLTEANRMSAKREGGKTILTCAQGVAQNRVPKNRAKGGVQRCDSGVRPWFCC
jgi:hypothetical protein